MKYSKLALALLVVPTTFAMLEVPLTINAHAETTGTQWIQQNWLNYPSSIGKWNVASVNGKTALGTTQNVDWTGYLNTNALQTTDSVFNFKMYQNETGDDDNMGWTFRHTYTGNYSDIKNHSFYVFISNGVNKNGSMIPSGLYKKTVGKYASQADMQLLAPVDHRRAQKTEYNVSIDVKDEKDGTRIKIYIGGVLKANYLDTNPLEAGGYGPFSLSQAYAYFYDININGASFLNAPPSTTVTSSVTNGERKFRGDIISVSGTSFDNDTLGSDNIKTYYKFDNKGEEVLLPTTIDSNGKYVFAEDIMIPKSLEEGEHTLYIYSKDSQNGESKKEEIKFYISDKYEYMVKVIGTFEATTIDVSVPAINTFLFNPNRNEMTAQDILVQNNSNAPVYMKVNDILVSDESSWKPNLIAPTTYTSEGWNNLTKTQTQSQVALGLTALAGDNWLKGIENPFLWSSHLNNINKLGTIKTKSTVEAQPVLKSGTSLSLEQMLTANYIFEFGLE
jgi:hypothetical protein